MIIGILAALALPKFDDARQRAKYTTLKSALRSIATQQEIYYNRYGRYAGTVSVLDFAPGPSVNLGDPQLGGGGDGLHGYSVTATHDGLAPGLGCVLYEGLMPGPVSAVGAVADRAGVPSCAD